MHDTPQLTPPCGGDHIIIGKFLSYGDFNPRPLAGATWASCPSDLSSSYFNPRPLAGATTWVLQRYNYRLDFNPRPLAGATPVLFFNIWTCAISIHAPLRGRQIVQILPKGTFYFNPRPLAGATEINKRVGNGADISIHAPLRGRQKLLFYCHY